MLKPGIQKLGRSVAQVSYIDRAGLRIRDLLQPDPERIRQTVLVVSNR